MLLSAAVSTFKGKTMVISGASRGIGLAIAKKVAADGANIVILAKTKEPHPRLPGTIYTAAEEIEAAGGQALPLVCDIRHDDQVQSCVAQAVEKFGGIDMLINNASAISLTGTLETPMKRYDLMNQVNARGTYSLSQACLPHLLKADDPTVLMNSPPLSMKTKWFQNHTAYTMAKYGMSMCVLGMAGEFEGKVGFNALWPRTAIATAAVGNLLGGESSLRKCRKPQIMADAAYEVLKKGKAATGNFFIDDEVLKEAGVTDFDQYAVDPSEELMLDFFLD